MSAGEKSPDKTAPEVAVRSVLAPPCRVALWGTSPSRRGRRLRLAPHEQWPGGGASAAAEAAPADLDELQLTETETTLQQEVHRAGVVVGFRPWQLFRRLLRDKERMKACDCSDGK